MSTRTSPGYELKLEQELKAPVARVWAALTDAEQIARWYGPSDEFRIEVKEWECRVGGSYRVAMHHRDGRTTHVCHGVFQSVKPQRQIAYTWAWEGGPPLDTLVTFELEDRAGQTLLTLRHTGFPAEDVREQHRTGWTGSLDRLVRKVA